MLRKLAVNDHHKNISLKFKFEGTYMYVSRALHQGIRRGFIYKHTLFMRALGSKIKYMVKIKYVGMMKVCTPVRQLGCKRV